MSRRRDRDRAYGIRSTPRPRDPLGEPGADRPLVLDRGPGGCDLLKPRPARIYAPAGDERRAATRQANAHVRGAA